MSILTPESFVLTKVQVALFFAPNSKKIDDNDRFYEITEQIGIKKDNLLRLPSSSKNIPFLVSQTQEKNFQISEERMDLIYQNLDLSENKIADFKDFLNAKQGEISKFVELGTFQEEKGIKIDRFGMVVSYLYIENDKTKFKQVINEIKQKHLTQGFGDTESILLQVEDRVKILNQNVADVTLIQSGADREIDQLGNSKITGYSVILAKDYNVKGEIFTEDRIKEFFEEFQNRCFKENLIKDLI
jgi:hypothetical protein